MSPRRWSPGQWALRAVTALAPALAALTTGLAGTWPAWWLVLALLAGGTLSAALPETVVGTVVLLTVACWWGIGLRDGLSWWSLPAAALLVSAHVSAVLISYGPGELRCTPALVRLWVRRGLLVLLSAPGVLVLALLMREATPPPGVWVSGAVAAFAALLAASWSLSRWRS